MPFWMTTALMPNLSDFGMGEASAACVCGANKPRGVCHDLTVSYLGQYFYLSGYPVPDKIDMYLSRLFTEEAQQQW